jgi:NTP pyrophosphatase (non-canonical NTP hydrolase)
MHNSKQFDPRVSERLLVLIEECAEVQQAVSKIFRFGTESKYPDENSPSNIDTLEQEIGDVLAMINSLVDLGFISQVNLYNASKRKTEKMKRWMST